MQMLFLNPQKMLKRIFYIQHMDIPEKNCVTKDPYQMEVSPVQKKLFNVDLIQENLVDARTSPTRMKQLWNRGC